MSAEYHTFAFEVADFSPELAGREILLPPNGPSDGVRGASIVENGAPFELPEFTVSEHPVRLSNQMDENGQLLSNPANGGDADHTEVIAVRG